MTSGNSSPWLSDTIKVVRLDRTARNRTAFTLVCHVRTKLTWKRRIDITIDIACALVFLHHECYHAIVRRCDVSSFGVLAMELATERRAVDRAVDDGEECLLEWARRVIGNGRNGVSRAAIPVVLLGSGAEEMCELMRVGISLTSSAAAIMFLVKIFVCSELLSRAI
ncbi:hypothetical protein Tsubulata_015034 [Turnera subulata]|uniref:Protein kinase domain-containing protein n=1 Tax=Turnera subulata TaxID=218843 RepID=A0A9Q0F495_9ROSI|nr:hypothetical protein Tsubulata_015034 [Turnera subulata]